MIMDKRINHFDQIAYIRRYTLTDGKEAGLKIVEVNNGCLRFLLNESKALDISQFWHNGMNVSFLSKNGLNMRETPFANRFEGGMLYTCGLDSVGGREGYELHGSHHNSPARILRAECTEEGITVVAEITETELFGKKLIFTRKVFTAIGSDCVKIEDTLENCAYRDEQYCLLYHVNLGYPMIDEGAKITAEIAKVRARTPWAKKQETEHKIITAPADNQEEMCYFLKFRTPQISLINEKVKKAFIFSWSGDTLPYFVEWKSMASGDYALGLEPCTTELDGGFAYQTIKTGECVRFSLNIKVSDIK